MLIALSKRVEGQKQHVVLVCEPQEMLTAAPVIAHVLDGYRPERRMDQNTGKWRYLFHKRFLDDLLLAFPNATKSRGLQRRLDRLADRDLEYRQVEPFEIPNLWDRKNDCPAIPFDYQYMAIAECVRYVNGEMDEMKWKDFIENFLLNDEMGLGKTLVLLCTILMLQAIQQRELKVLYIAPKNGKFVVQRENARWTDMDVQVVDADEMVPAKRHLAIQRRANITVINPEMLRGSLVVDPETGDDVFEGKYPDLFNFEYDLVIIDEYHRFGSPTSQQTQGLLALKGERFLPASGTPYLNRPEQMWPVLHRCWPTIYPDYDQYVKSIQIVDRGTGKVVGYDPKFTRGLKEFMELRSLRRRKDQVLKDLPEVMPIDLPIELNREQRRIYNKIRDEAIMVLESGESRNITFESTVALRLKQACFSPELFGGSKHSAKIDELVAYVESLVASNEKALIFSEWSKATRILERELKKFNPAYVDGTVTGQNRMAQADRFNLDPECHIYIGTIGANREAVSLGAATTVIFTDKDPSPMVNAQAAGRSAAGGIRGMEATVPHISVVSMWGVDTYEEEIEEVLRFKQGHFNAIIESDGGLRTETQEVKSLLALLTA